MRGERRLHNSSPLVGEREEENLISFPARFRVARCSFVSSAFYFRRSSPDCIASREQSRVYHTHSRSGEVFFVGKLNSRSRGWIFHSAERGIPIVSQCRGDTGLSYRPATYERFYLAVRP